MEPCEKRKTLGLRERTEGGREGEKERTKGGSENMVLEDGEVHESRALMKGT